MTEDGLEALCLEWFKEGGWEVAQGADISLGGSVPKRNSFAQFLLTQDLEQAIRDFNPQLPDDAVTQALSIVSYADGLDMVRNNRTFHNLLINGVPVQYKDDEGEQVYDHAYLINFDDLEQNTYLAVNQFTLEGSRQLRRPDIVCFINGLPIAVIELKSPIDANVDIWDAYNQIQTYKEEIPELFTYNEAIVISDGFNARVGSLTAREERFMPWRTLKHEDDKPFVEWELETVVKGFFDRELLLKYIRYFVIFETHADRQVKKIAAYHQFHAVLEAVKATIIASKPPAPYLLDDRRATYNAEIQPGGKKAGVIWHTQGSGKSMSMCCYAGMLVQQYEMNNPTIVVVTDRNDLDGQLFATFSAARDLLKQDPIQAHDRKTLRRLLSERESGGIIFTTVQKFTLLEDEEDHPVLNERHNIVVISDEAHRSQYGLTAMMKSDGSYSAGYASHMRTALPNASFIGFTGTPISAADRDTRAVFGDYVSIYDIQDAVADGATVPILYEPRQAKLNINHAEIESLSERFEEIVEEEEDVKGREKTKGQWSRLERLVGATPRLQMLAADLVAHFEQRLKTMDGKAMIVTMSRDICVRLYNEIVKIRPEWHDPDPEKGVLKVVMTGSASDKQLLQPHIYNQQTKKRLEARFKDPNDPLRLVIVRDMWLTGFDAPVCHTMYVDKPMKGHNLMQAIARVNRVFKNKPGGLVVDYIGLVNELKLALQTYTESKGRGEPTVDIHKAYEIMVEKLEQIRDLFAPNPPHAGFDYSGYEDNAMALLLPTANYVLGLGEGKNHFLDAVLALNKAYALCSTLDEAQDHQKEIAFLSAVKTAITKSTSVGDKLKRNEKDSVLMQILDDSIVAEGVADIFGLCGLEKPNISELTSQFLYDVADIPHQNLAVELLEKLLEDTIRSKTRTNVAQEIKYSDRLKETLRKYNNRTIEAAKVIQELIEMAKDLEKELERDEALGLNPDELAFYDALANLDSATDALSDETLKEIAIEITKQLRSNAKVDWQVRESVRAQLRLLVRAILNRYQYPTTERDKAIELVMKQAEVLSDYWGSAA